MSKIEETPEPVVMPIYWVVLGVSVLSLAGYLAWNFFSGGAPAPEILVQRALTADDSQERLRAATHVAAIADRDVAIPHLETLVKDSQDPAVLALAITSLLPLDSGKLPLYFPLLNHSNKKVRAAAYRQLEEYYREFPGELSLDPEEASAEERAQFVSKLQAAYQAELEERKKEEVRKRAEMGK